LFVVLFVLLFCLSVCPLLIVSLFPSYSSLFKSVCCLLSPPLFLQSLCCSVVPVVLLFC
jgi:hypothetical protein